uniref:uncharacterized protein LOC120348481 isoform X1 n=2 Tax=Styela clava TaxID=7725 RepID=UPI001939A958|nr:uncharacterized protein LOC120348481 isoform X1 [Styela clava]
MIWLKHRPIFKICRVVAELAMLVVCLLYFMSPNRILREDIRRNSEETIPIRKQKDADEISRLLAMRQWNCESRKSNKFQSEGEKVKDTNELCPKWANELDWKPSDKPLIQLNPARIIYPANQNGPSNELISFQEAIFIGIETNRTVVVPQFLPHRMDRDTFHESEVPASRRVDLNFLSRLVSMVTVDKMQELCYLKFDVGFQKQDAECNFFSYLKKTSGMIPGSTHDTVLGTDGFTEIKMLKKHDRACEPPSFPVRRMAKIKRAMRVDDVKYNYRSDLPCAVLIDTYKTFTNDFDGFDQAILDKAINDINSLTHEDLIGANSRTKFKLVEIFTKRPRYIREIAKEFIGKVMQGDEYIAMHWRYNHEFICFHKYPFCAQIEKVESRDLSEVIILASKNFTSSKVSKYSNCDGTQVVHVYLATATTDYETIKFMTKDSDFQREIFRKILKKEGKADEISYYGDQRCWKVQLFNKVDLYRFIDSHYPREKCSVIWRDTHELIALVENEICRQSSIFIYSPESAWSEIAMQTRTNNVPVWDVLSELAEINAIDEIY